MRGPTRGELRAITREAPIGIGKRRNPMNKHIAFGACLLALSFVTAGCLEAKQDFEVHGDGSGVLQLEFKLGKEISSMASSEFEGKTQAQLDAMAAAQMGDQFEGVYWETMSQKMVDGQVVLAGTGVFADVTKVKMISEEMDMSGAMEEGAEPKMVKKEQLTFTFEQTDAGGKLTMKMDSGQAAGMGGGAPEGMEGNEEFAKEMAKMMEEAIKPMLEQMKGFKFQISAKVPGDVTKSELKDLGKGRHGILIDVDTVKKQALAGKGGLDGSIEWKGKRAAPTGFADRLAKAKKAWEAGAKARADLKAKLEAEKAEGGEMDLEDLEKKLKEAEGGKKDEK
jgi:hypothetical protein